MTTGGNDATYRNGTLDTSFSNGTTLTADQGPCIGNRSTAALAFGDPELAKENLAALNFQPAVEAACIYNKQGLLFAQHLKAPLKAAWICPQLSADQYTHFDENQLFVLAPVVNKNETEGSILVHADFQKAYLRKIQFTLVVFMVLTGGAVIAFILTGPFIRLIALPVKNLVRTVKTISETKNYSLRAVFEQAKRALEAMRKAA
jgi:hypothetical protein